MKKIFLSPFLVLLLITSTDKLVGEEESTIQVDLLFLKIQELELELANLRNDIESQNYLIQKLINESVPLVENANDNSITDLANNSNLRFKGIEDSKSKEDVYKAAIEALENQDFKKALSLFKYFVQSFNDDEKNPLAYFWLGEISMIENDLDSSEIYFMELVSSFPSHYRVPLAHKKIGDIYLKKNDLEKAKNKYNFVAREFPNDTASSLALQLLKNME
tara:strand:- start:3 stop:662 length:660 start_codon:yes stop_codon:yes gene_type:complete